MNDELRLTRSQEARVSVLNRMWHARWCPWKELRDCQCKAGRLMLALIEAEVDEAIARMALHSEDDAL